MFRKLSLVGVRRLLEEDLKLEKNTLDPYKKFISKQLDEVTSNAKIFCMLEFLH